MKKVFLFVGLLALGFALSISVFRLPRIESSLARETADARQPVIVPTIPALGAPKASATGLPARRAPVFSSDRQKALASGKPAPLAASTRLETLGLQQVPPPGKVPLHHGRYALVSNLYALPESEFRASAELTPIEHSAGYVFFRVDSGRSAPVGALPAVINTGNQLLGAVTGVVRISSSAGLWDRIGSDYRLSVVQVFEHLNFGLFQSGRSNSAELLSLVAALRRDGRVKEADLEIQDNLLVTQ